MLYGRSRDVHHIPDGGIAPLVVRALLGRCDHFGGGMNGVVAFQAVKGSAIRYVAIMQASGQYDVRLPCSYQCPKWQSQVSLRAIRITHPSGAYSCIGVPASCIHHPEWCCIDIVNHESMHLIREAGRKICRCQLCSNFSALCPSIALIGPLLTWRIDPWTVSLAVELTVSIMVPTINEHSVCNVYSL